MGWGGFLDNLLKKLPIPNRVEGIKNEIDKLEKERSEILVHKAEVKQARRLEYIDSRLFYLRKRLTNLASD
jgi:hypothetical protein